MKTLVCFTSHVVNDALIKRFLSIKEAIKDKADIIYVSPNVYIENDNINNYIVNLNIKENFLDKLNFNHTQNNLVYINVFNKFKDYDYYWFIENDVTINNENIIEGWRNLFNFYQYNNSDLICSKIHRYTDYSGYQLRYPQKDLDKYDILFNYKKLVFGFYTICRLSNKLIKLVDEYYKLYNGFFEYIITTIAVINNLKISSLSEDKFDIEEFSSLNRGDGINLGSNTWSKDYLLSHILDYPENVILHPIKL